VFIFTTWEKLAFTRQFMVVWYGLKSITSRFLIDVVHEIITALFAYGFIVTALSSDGASENRSTFHSLSTHTV
jgi:hypothetical protein